MTDRKVMQQALERMAQAPYDDDQDDEVRR